MLPNWRFPEYKTIRYTLNNLNNWYQITNRPKGFKKLPDELKIRPTYEPKMKAKAENIIEGHTVNKRKEFFTGLSSTKVENLFFGDDGYNSHKSKSFILFQFNTDKTTLICYHFNDYTPPTPQRDMFIDYFLKVADLKELQAV